MAKGLKAARAREFVHALDSVVEALSYCPPAWREIHPHAEPFPWWFCINSNAQQMLNLLGLAPIQVRSDHATKMQLGKPFPAVRGTHKVVASTIKSRLRALAAKQSRAPVDPCDVLVLLPQRGWEGQGNQRNNRDNEYLGSAIRALEADGQSVVTTTHMLEGGMPASAAYKLAKKRGPINGAPHVWLEKYWDRNASDAMAQTAKHFDQLFTKSTARELGFDADGESGDKLIAWLRSQVWRLALYAGWYPTIVNIAREHGCKVLLTAMESFPHHRVMIAACRMEGIPSISVQHGWIGANHAGYFFAPKYDELDRYVRSQIRLFQPSCLAVYGQAQRDILLNGPWEAKQIEIVGSPRYDAIANMDQLHQRRFVREKIGLTKQKLILWPTQTHGLSDAENRANVAAWLHLLGEHPEYRLAIKLHPMESQAAQMYEPLFAAGAIKLDRQEALWPWLAACDLVVTRNSTAAIEGAAMGRPVLVLNLLGTPEITDYVSGKMARAATSVDELETVVARLLRNPAHDKRNRAKYVERNLLAVDGKAGARVAELVACLLR